MTLVSKKKTNKRLASFVSLAVGMALNFFLPGAGTAIGAMAQATGTAAASQFAGRVVANNGDLGHALKDMRSKQAMRSLIAAAATANFGGSSAPISSLDQFVESLPAYLAKGMGTGAVSAAIQKQNILRGMAEGAQFGVASAVGNWGATNIGRAYNYGEGQISYAEHKLRHFALGGGLGAFISKDRLKGALIGGLSAGGAEIVDELRKQIVGFKVLTGQGAQIDTTTSNGRLVFGLFASLAEYERELIHTGLKAARTRGRLGGRPRKMAMAAMDGLHFVAFINAAGPPARQNAVIQIMKNVGYNPK